jgi:hypothetical protein
MALNELQLGQIKLMGQLFAKGFHQTGVRESVELIGPEDIKIRIDALTAYAILVILGTNDVEFRLRWDDSRKPAKKRGYQFTSVDVAPRGAEVGAMALLQKAHAFVLENGFTNVTSVT